MRVCFRTTVALSALALAVAKPVLPRTLWERSPKVDKARKLDTSSGSSVDMLRNLLSVNEGTLQAFASVTDNLVKATAFQNVSSAGFDKMFNTFKILQDAPAYQQAIASQADLSNPKTQVDVLSKSVTQFMNLAVNLFSAMDKNGGQTFNDKMVSFFDEGGEEVLEDANKVAAGDSGAVQKLQQQFVDKNFPGLNLQTIQDDEFIQNRRQILKNDEGFQSLMNNDADTMNVLIDEDLLFANSPINPSNQA